jgi:uroporphyrin-III C-methyltransferase / precorrin-2 dehydrogenase / sirohydrochlorin ferrochelatase
MAERLPLSSATSQPDPGLRRGGEDSWPGLPILVKLAGQPVILLGTGEPAAAKRRLLERAGARVVDAAPDARLAVVALTDGAEQTAAELRARGLLVNVVDRPELCDWTVPAIVDRAPVLVAIATGGTSAGLAAALRQRLETLLPPRLGRLARTLHALRPRLRERYPAADARRQAIGAALIGPLDPLSPDAADRAEQVLLHGEAAPEPLHLTLTSPDPDDLTLRQARALALAGRVLHAPIVPAAILARARADAPRLASPAAPAQMQPGDVWIGMA